jgi:hypothetical protein
MDNLYVYIPDQGAIDSHNHILFNGSNQREVFPRVLQTRVRKILYEQHIRKVIFDSVGALSYDSMFPLCFRNLMDDMVPNTAAIPDETIPKKSEEFDWKDSIYSGYTNYYYFY